MFFGTLILMSESSHLYFALLIFLGMFLGTTFLGYINCWWIEETVPSEAETTRSYLSF